MTLPKPARPSPAAQGPDILLLVREAAVLEALGAALQGLHLRPEKAPDLESALARARSLPLRLAVLEPWEQEEPLRCVDALRRAARRELPVLLLTPGELRTAGSLLPGRCVHLPADTAPARLRQALLDLLEDGADNCRDSEQGAFFRSLAEYLGGALVIADACDGRILEWPQRAESLFGVAAAQALGRPFPEILEPLLGPAGGFAGLEAPENRVLHEQATLRRPDAAGAPLLRSVFTGRLGGRQVLALYFHDLSSHMAREQQLGIAQRLESIGRLAAGIAHEINTPIQYIGDNIRFLEKSYASMAGVLREFLTCLAGVRGGEDPRPHLTRIEAAIASADLDFLEAEIPAAIAQSLEGVEHVTSIVLGMKKFSHPEREEWRYADLNQALRDALLVARNEWKYVAEVVTDFDERLPLVNCLAGDLNQVFLNIIINAAQAVEESVRERGGRGRIEVGTRRAGEWAEIRVQDSGVGIPAAFRDKIFDPFFTTKAVGRGTGQGLAIAHSIVVDKHGGSITVQSEEGHGACFFIRLPLGGAKAGERP
jgi:signal transduction histidine kinase